jgi:hypothetical protein
LTKPASKILRILTWLFYALFIVLWFKDNIDALKKYRVGCLFALVPLAVVIGLRLVLAFKSGKIVFRFRLDKTVLVLVGLLILAAAVRWPYVMYGERLVNSDDGIAALMGKHIAEGKVPPICFYGQNYLGSLSNHFYALFFVVFGYSVLALKAATLLFYLGFITVQFFLLKKAVCLSFAAVTSLFYSLPFGQLLLVSADNSSAYGFILFLGSLILWIAAKIGFEGKTSWLPAFGFVAGLSFWAHPVTASFSLAAVLLLLIKKRLGLRSFAGLAFYGILGCWPLIFQEIFERFRIFRFLAGGDKGSFAAEKMNVTVQNLKSLLAPLGEKGLGTVLLLILPLGTAVLLWRVIRAKGKTPALALLLFPAVFGVMFWFSGFGASNQVRYMYPLYVILPPLLLAPFLLIRSRLGVVFAAAFALAAVMANGWPTHRTFAESVKNESLRLRQVVDGLRATGERHWQASYWTAYSLTAIGGENPVVDAFSSNRYWPYRLEHYGQNDRDNFVFLSAPDEAADFSRLLSACRVPFERTDIGDAALFFRIGVRVYPAVLFESPPSVLPEISVVGSREENGYLVLDFKNSAQAEAAGFRVNIEIPDYSAVSVAVPEASGVIRAKIPAPPRKLFPVRYGLDFKGLRIPPSVREFTFTCPGDAPAPRTDLVVYLRGIGDPVDRFGASARDCGKDVALEIAPARSRAARLRFVFWNPFAKPDVRWYGRYTQSVRIAVGDSPPTEVPLPDFETAVDVGLGDGIPAGRPLPITLTFKYRSLFDFAPERILSAMLVRVDILE